MKPRPDLAIENVDGELIVLDKKAGKVHRFNSSASFVWSCLSDGLAPQEMALLLSEAFDIELDAALSDVKSAISQFEGLALVVE